MHDGPFVDGLDTALQSFVDGLDTALQSFKVKHQQYFGEV